MKFLSYTLTGIGKILHISPSSSVSETTTLDKIGEGHASLKFPDLSKEEALSLAIGTALIGTILSSTSSPKMKEKLSSQMDKLVATTNKPMDEIVSSFKKGKLPKDLPLSRSIRREVAILLHEDPEMKAVTNFLSLQDINNILSVIFLAEGTPTNATIFYDRGDNKLHSAPYSSDLITWHYNSKKDAWSYKSKTGQKIMSMVAGLTSFIVSTSEGIRKQVKKQFGSNKRIFSRWGISEPDVSRLLNEPLITVIQSHPQIQVPYLYLYYKPIFLAAIRSLDLSGKSIKLKKEYVNNDLLPNKVANALIGKTSSVSEAVMVLVSGQVVNGAILGDLNNRNEAHVNKHFLNQGHVNRMFSDLSAYKTSSFHK